MSDTTKMYQIPCSWQVYAHANIEATSLEEAIKFAESDQFPLPEGSYVEASFEIDYEIIESSESDYCP
jgi:hypothetical protein